MCRSPRTLGGVQEELKSWERKGVKSPVKGGGSDAQRLGSVARTRRTKALDRFLSGTQMLWPARPQILRTRMHWMDTAKVSLPALFSVYFHPNAKTLRDVAPAHIPAAQAPGSRRKSCPWLRDLVCPSQCDGVWERLPGTGTRVCTASLTGLEVQPSQKVSGTRGLSMCPRNWRC